MEMTTHMSLMLFHEFDYFDIITDALDNQYAHFWDKI